MDPEELLEALRQEGAAMARAAETAGLDAPVPSCPEWDVRQLLNHTGRVHRWATAMLRSRSSTRLEFPPRPQVVDTEWFSEGLTELTAALAEIEPDTPVWTFPAGNGTARFWFVRQAAETAVHRWDAELAAGQPQPITAGLAITGIDEVFDVLLAGRPGAGLDGSIHFHATDAPHGTEGEWTAAVAPDGDLRARRGHEKGDAALRGTASDLYLWLWGREVPAGRLEVFGDGSIVERWPPTFGIG